MNLLLFEPDEITADRIVTFSGRRGKHVSRILGCRPGDTVRAGIVNGPVGSGEIVSIQENKVVLRFNAETGQPEQPDVDLILGLVRPIMLKKILAQAASLGAGRIFLINGNRVEKSFFNAGILEEKKYRPYLIEGLEQARHTYLPEVSVHKRFRPFVEDFIPAVAETYSNMLVAHPEADKNLKQAIGSKISGRTLLAVGPEGGWVDFEIDRFIEHGFTSVSMGDRVLRTDTAVVALLAQLTMLYNQ
jgi:16S rRNA (uracil1498-N3)-methyltransferase